MSYDYTVLWPARRYVDMLEGTLPDVFTHQGITWEKKQDSSSVTWVIDKGAISYSGTPAQSMYHVSLDTLPWPFSGGSLPDIITIEFIWENVSGVNPAANHMGAGIAGQIGADTSGNNSKWVINYYNGAWSNSVWSDANSFDEFSASTYSPVDLGTHRIASTYFIGKGGGQGRDSFYIDGQLALNDVKGNSWEGPWQTLCMNLSGAPHAGGNPEDRGMHSFIAYPGTFKDVLGRVAEVKPQRSRNRSSIIVPFFKPETVAVPAEPVTEILDTFHDTRTLPDTLDGHVTDTGQQWTIVGGSDDLNIQAGGILRFVVTSGDALYRLNSGMRPGQRCIIEYDIEGTGPGAFAYYPMFGWRVARTGRGAILGYFENGASSGFAPYSVTTSGAYDASAAPWDGLAIVGQNKDVSVPVSFRLEYDFPQVRGYVNGELLAIMTGPSAGGSNINDLVFDDVVCNPEAGSNPSGDVKNFRVTLL